MRGVEPRVKLHLGAWTLGLGAHCYRERVEVSLGRLLICLPGIVIARGWLI